MMIYSCMCANAWNWKKNLIYISWDGSLITAIVKMWISDEGQSKVSSLLSSQWLINDVNDVSFALWYQSLLQSQSLYHHKMNSLLKLNNNNNKLLTRRKRFLVSRQESFLSFTNVINSSIAQKCKVTCLSFRGIFFWNSIT